MYSKKYIETRRGIFTEEILQSRPSYLNLKEEENNCPQGLRCGQYTAEATKKH